MKKTIKILSYILTGVLLFSIFVLVYAGTTAIRKNEIVTILGKGYSVVVTNSMEPTIKVGEFIIVEEITYDEAYQMVVEDKDPILVYKSDRGIHIVHRAIDVDGELIMMKGDNPRAPIDSERVSESNLVGIVTKTTMFFGIGKVLVNSRSLIFLVAILAFVVLLVMEISSIYKQLKLRTEERMKADIEAEKQRFINEQKEALKKELEDALKNDKTKG